MDLNDLSQSEKDTYIRALLACNDNIRFGISKYQEGNEHIWDFIIISHKFKEITGFYESFPLGDFNNINKEFKTRKKFNTEIEFVAEYVRKNFFEKTLNDLCPNQSHLGNKAVVFNESDPKFEEYKQFIDEGYSLFSISHSKQN